MKIYAPLLLLSMAGLVACQQPNVEQAAVPTATTKPVEVANLLVGTYTRKEGHVDGQAEGIYAYHFNTATGALSHKGTSSGLVSPSYLAVNKDRTLVYAGCEIGSKPEEESGEVAVVAFNRDSASFEVVSKIPSTGLYTCHVALSPDEKHLMAANYGGGVSHWNLDENGVMIEPGHDDRHPGRRTHPRQADGSHIHQIYPVADDQFMVADLGLDRIWSYAISEDGIVLKDSLIGQDGDGPRHMVMHENGTWLYQLNELSGTITQWSKGKGGWSESQRVTNTNDSTPENGHCGAIKMHPNGQYLYASNRGGYNNISIFEVDPNTGNLSFKASVDAKGKTPRDFAIHPSGKWLLIANQDSSSIVVYALGEDGAPSGEGQVFEVPTPVCLLFL